MKLLFALTIFAFISFSNFCESTLTNVEQEHLQAEVWKKSDGKYFLKVIENDLTGNEFYHLYTFDDLIHAEECQCDLRNYY